MYFRNYGLGKTWRDKYLKSPVEKYPLKSNMVNGHKNCSNLNGDTLTIFINHCEGN